MEKAHPYEEPVAPPPLCAFKYEASKFGVVRDAYEQHRDAVENFGAFARDQPRARRLASSPEDFETKVRAYTVLSSPVATTIIQRYGSPERIRRLNRTRVVSSLSPFERLGAGLLIDFRKRLAANENRLRKVTYKTDAEVFVVIVRRVSEEAFLAFAGIEPYFLTEVDEEAREMTTEYFPEGAEDVIPLAPHDEEEALYEEEDYEEEGEELEEASAFY